MNQRKCLLPCSPSLDECYFANKTKGPFTEGSRGKTEHRDAGLIANHLLHAVVKKGEAGVLVADEGALLDEADEDLRLGELGVELLVGAVSTFEKSCRKARTGCCDTS